MYMIINSKRFYSSHILLIISFACSTQIRIWEIKSKLMNCSLFNVISFIKVDPRITPLLHVLWLSLSYDSPFGCPNMKFLLGALFERPLLGAPICKTRANTPSAPHSLNLFPHEIISVYPCFERLFLIFMDVNRVTKTVNLSRNCFRLRIILQFSRARSHVTPFLVKNPLKS